MRPPARDPWTRLKRWTPARIALGRTGASVPTREVLGFALAHARARDAVHTPFESAAVAGQLRALSLEVIEVESEAADRSLYLRRPDYGRRLSAAARECLAMRQSQPSDLALVVGDGLSAAAVHAHAVEVVSAFLPHATRLGLSLAPVVVARGARVALGDAIGVLLRAKAVAVLIGERPGLSCPDSLGIYLTFAPRPGRTDAERNCISNIQAQGLSYAQAAYKLAWLVREAFARSFTGVNLKDNSGISVEDDRIRLLGGA
jgi:ethanolamine ammonia-lyase small subunit